MDQQSAEAVLTDILARWDKEDSKKLGRELVRQLDLTCDLPWESFSEQVSKLVSRRLNRKEKAVLDYLYDKLCSHDGGGHLAVKK